jgi:putative restriction endonuclease
MAPTLSKTDQARLRLDVFAWLETRMQEKGHLTWDELQNDYVFEGHRIQLVGQRGITNPSILDETLCVQTSFRNPYLDEHSEGPIQYKFEAQHGNTGGSNKKLRAAMDAKVPIAYLQGIASGIYVAWVNVFITGEDLSAGHVTLNLDPAAGLLAAESAPNEIERSYALRMAKQRVHQPKFRAEVLLAYQTQCSICRLKHGELLDAAHIVPDSHELGSAIVTNGIALCKIHHTAYDKRILGITPDYVVKVNEQILLEVDGPMLKHGIQAMHNTEIYVPDQASKRPDKKLLDLTYSDFLKSA